MHFWQDPLITFSNSIELNDREKATSHKRTPNQKYLNNTNTYEPTLGKEAAIRIIIAQAFDAKLPCIAKI